MLGIAEDEDGKSKTLEIPAIPTIHKEGETETTEEFQRVQQKCYPPIFAENSWTKGVLQKDVEAFYRPSECIGEQFLFMQ